MSLMPCPDCQTEVSTSAKSCPKCGRWLERKDNGKAFRILGAIGFNAGFFGMILMGIIGIGGNGLMMFLAACCVLGIVVWGIGKNV